MNYPPIQEISISELNSGLFGDNNTRKATSGTIELTQRCNLKCVHCYIRLPRNDKQAKRRELSYAEITRILDNAVDEGCLWLLMTGGEPLVRPDFPDIYMYAKKKGIMVTLFTNGALITESVADFLAEYTPYRVEISIYGATEKTHDRVTMVPGSFRRTHLAIERLLKRNITLKLKSVAMDINHEEIFDMQKFSAGLNLSFRYDPIINAALKDSGSEQALCHRLTPEQVVEMDRKDEQRSENYREFCALFEGEPEHETLYGCGAGLNNFHIDPYGQMSLCMSARWPSYDLRTGSFGSGFHEFLPSVRAEKPKTEYKCGKCNLHSLCGNCPGTAFPETGDRESVVDYYCKVAHLRKEAFGKEVRL